MPRFVRVRDRQTGHQYDVDERAVDPAAHTRVHAPVRYPDLDGDGARPRPAKHHVDKAGQPARTAPPATTTATGRADAPTDRQDGTS